MHYIRSLELSNIKNEDWKAWSTYLGSTHQTMSHDSLQSDCRTYYSTHMAPLKALQPQEYAYAASTSPHTQHPNTVSSTAGTSSSQTAPSGRGRGRGNDRGNTGRGGRGGGSRSDGDVRRNLPRDPNAWCTNCERAGHAASFCYNKYKDSGSTISFAEWCASQPAPPPPQYSATSTTAPSPTIPNAPSNRQPKARGLTVRACRCHSTSDPDTWIFDTACTEHMTDQPLHYTTYDAFATPIEVHGIGGLLHALGEGTVTLIDPNGYTHKLTNVWYVPGLGDSIISKYWTRNCDLITSLDRDENFVLSTKLSNFTIKTSNIGKMTVFQNLKVAGYPPTTVATANVTTTTLATPTSDPPTPKVRAYIPTKVSAKLMHQ